MSDLKTWLRVSRFNFLPTSLLPYCLGAAVAGGAGLFNLPIFLAGFLGTALVHLAANLFNEYWDYRFQADSAGDEYLPHFGGSKAIQTGLVTPAAVHRASWLSLLSGCAIGFLLSIFLETLLLFVLVLGGCLIAWAYTAPPLSLAYRGWGEISLGTAFGPLLVLGAFYLQAEILSPRIAVVSILPGLMIAVVLIGNEFADAGGDDRAGKRNLAVRLGNEKAFGILLVGLILAYLIPAAGVITGIFEPLLLLLFLALPLAVDVSRQFRRALQGKGDFPSAAAAMIRLYFIYHLLLIGIFLF